MTVRQCSRSQKETVFLSENESETGTPGLAWCKENLT